MAKDKKDKNKKEQKGKKKFGEKKFRLLIKLLSEWLDQWDGGAIPSELFTLIAGMTPQPIMEVVSFRYVGDVLETLLIPRPDGDIVWAGMLHNAGTAFRNKDIDNDPIAIATARVKRELGNIEILKLTFVKHMFTKSERGKGLVLLYIAEIDPSTELDGAEWVPVSKLKNHPRFIQSQLSHVLAAARSYSIRHGQKSVRKRA